MAEAFKIIDFSEGIKGESVLQSAAKSVRSLKKDITDLSASVDADSARINKGIVSIAEAIAALKGKTLKLELVSDADKKLLADYAKQVGELGEAQKKLKDEEKAGAAIKKTLADAAKSATEALKGQQQAFKEAASAGDTEAAKKAAAAIQDIKAQSDQAARAIRGANSEYTAASGSINDLRLKLSAGTAAYIALSKAERENVDVGVKLRDSNKALSDELKTLEKGIGDTRRNVGNYGDAFRGAAATGVLPFNNQINQAIQTADQLKGGLAAVRNGLFGVKEGGEVAGVGLNIVKVGIASTGIGLLVVALAALYEYFTKSDDGAEDLAAGLSYLKGVFSVLEGAAVSVGRELSLVFKDPKQLAADLVDFLGNQVVNRVKAVDLIFQSVGKGNFGGALEAAAQLATGVENVVGKTKELVAETKRAADISRELSRAGDQLEDLEIANIARTEKQAQLAAKLVLTAKDRNLSEAQRLTNLDKAGALETSNLKNALEIENKRLKIIQDTNAESVRRLGMSGIADDDRRKEQEQIASIARLQGEYEQQQQVIANRKSVLQKTEREEEAKAAKEARERELEAQREAIREREVGIKRQLLAVQAGSDEELALKKQLLAAEAELENINDKKSKNAKLLTTESELVDELKLEQEYAKRRADEERKRIEAAKAEKEREYNESVQGLNDYLAKQRTVADEDYLVQLQAANGNYTLIEKAKEEHEKRLADIEARGLDGLISVQKDYDKSTADAEEKRTQNSIKNLEKVTAAAKKEQERRQKIEQRATQAATELGNNLFGYQSARLQAQADQEDASYTNSVKAAGTNKALLAKIEADHAKKVAEIRQKQAENEKRQALFNIIISTAQAIARDIKEFGFPIAIPFIAADVAIGAVQLATVAAQPIPQYFKGRKGGPAELAMVAERGPELIHEKKTNRYVYEAKPIVRQLGEGDAVFTAHETTSMLAEVGLRHHEAQQPGRVAAAFSGAAEGARASREGQQHTGVDSLARGQAEIAAALRKFKPTVVNVHRGSDATLEASRSITHYHAQRTFKEK